MKYIEVYSDERHGIDKSNSNSQCLDRCIYCGEVATNGLGDHIPARRFLNKPYPEGKETVVTVPACVECNNKTSLDEEYAAFVLKFIKYGDGSEEVLSFKNHATLRGRLYIQYGFWKDKIIFENERVKRIIVKYGYALARYECSVSVSAEPKQITYGFIDEITSEKYKKFNECVLFDDIAPEIGTRISQMVIIETNCSMAKVVVDWKVVQEDVFRYIAFFNDDNDIVVRMVFDEMFYAETIFEQC
jgi:hypothetical protein